MLTLSMAAVPGQAALRVAASGTYADVSDAITKAADGDTIRIPAGNVTWTSTLVVPNGRAISIIGAGKGVTNITNGVGNLIKWANTGSKPFRLSGITFNNSDSQTPIIALVGPISKARIDHCVFNKGDCAVGTNYFFDGLKGSGPVYGVVDHCEFYNMTRAYYAMDVRASGESSGWGTVAWTEGIRPGTDRMMYFEDNQFIWDQNLTDLAHVQGAVYGSYGGKVCFRYNTCRGFYTYIDAHGDNPDQSTVYYEIYNNTFIEDNRCGAQGDIAWQRGGQWIAYNNTFTGPTKPFRLSVYWETDAASHRVKNTYFWDNTWNGNNHQSNLVQINDSGQTAAAYSGSNIRVEEQYFLHPPQEGQTYFPYSALIHPHPLVTTMDGPAPPQALRISTP